MANHTEGLLEVDAVHGEAMHELCLADPPEHAGNPVVIASFNDGEHLPISSKEAEANAKRAAACWNACDGIATKALKGGIIARLIADLTELADVGADAWGEQRPCVRVARETLAKLKA